MAKHKLPPPEFFESAEYQPYDEVMARYKVGNRQRDASIVELIRGWMKGVRKATPKTLYVRRDLVNAEELVAWAKSQGFETALPPEKMHVTVAFSKTAMEWDKVRPPQGGPYVVKGGRRYLERLGDNAEAVVLRFDDKGLEARWDFMKTQGASWDFPAYKPHITISWSAPGLKVGKIKPFRGNLTFGPEVFEEIDEDWKAKLTEKNDDEADS